MNYPKGAVIRMLQQLFCQYGHRDYIGEPVSQLSHAVQTATLAKQKFGDANHAMVSAALLHDIGQLVGMKYAHMPKSSFGVMGHEVVGHNFLKQCNFSPVVCEMVRDHVIAKRYLSTIEPTYMSILSPASRATLLEQNGLLDAAQMAMVRRNPFFRQSLELRRLDDAAKKLVDCDFSELDQFWNSVYKTLL